MTEINVPIGTAQAVAMTEAVSACMRATAELQSRLATGWMDLLTRGATQPMAVAAWGMEAMRLTAETTLRNIEHCQTCARKAAEEAK